MKIQESAENYLETILILSTKNSCVKSIDIANEMNFSKPSISVAMKQFRENGYITMDENGYIFLTERGLAIAKKVLERHTILTECFLLLGVDEKTAREDACKVEHDLSEQTFIKIKEYINKTQKLHEIE